jgi:hypothetical protein
MGILPVRSIVRAANTIRANQSSSGVSRSLEEDGIEWWSQEESRLFAKWGSAFEQLETNIANPYFDYFYTGQDVEVMIEGLTDPQDHVCLYGFGYSIQQQKQPVYGFWSYTYDGMLRGTRIVTGAFSMIVKEPHGLTKKIAKATKIRANAAGNSKTSLNKVYGIDEDEANIERYWKRHYDSNLQINQQHLFSIHPPFNFIIRYGLQSTSLASLSPTMRAEQLRQYYKDEPFIHADYNERLVPFKNKELEHRILLENVELTSKSLEYNSEGDPILETYTFIARDERIVVPRDNSQMAAITNSTAGTVSTRGYN